MHRANKNLFDLGPSPFIQIYAELFIGFDNLVYSYVRVCLWLSRLAFSAFERALNGGDAKFI